VLPAGDRGEKDTQDGVGASVYAFAAKLSTRGAHSLVQYHVESTILRNVQYEPIDATGHQHGVTHDDGGRLPGSVSTPAQLKSSYLV